ncbi:MAG TPA: hypothetical protein VMW24_21060 [Sedimentisphaerales bacterium]|nr:hypothetical protein [Sedimentisphaerales bacterium]
MAKSKKLFDDAQSKGRELYESGKESWYQWWGSSDDPKRDESMESPE